MFDDRSPIYRQIADGITADILRGTLKGDERLMSTNQYAAFYRINPATAAKAFQQLADAGVIYKKRGVGMFVSPDAQGQLRAEHRRRFFADVVDPMVEQASAIGIPLDEVIARIHEHAAARETGGQS